MAQLVKNLPAFRKPGFNPWVGKILWRREMLPTPVLWPGEFHGLYSPWGHKESDTTEGLLHRASLVTQMVKNPLARWETWVRSLGWKDPLEESMANGSSLVAQTVKNLPTMQETQV